MSVSIQANSVISFANLAGGLDSTRDRVQRQQNCASQVNFFEKQKANLKNMECSTLEDIARKLEMFHSYEDQIAAVKQQYNNSQMAHVLDEAKEIGEKIAEEAEKTAPKTEEERREDRIEEAMGTEEESKGLLSEIMDEMADAMEELEEELEEQTQDQLEESLDESLEESLDKVLDEELSESLQEDAGEVAGSSLEEGLEAPVAADRDMQNVWNENLSEASKKQEAADAGYLVTESPEEAAADRIAQKQLEEKRRERIYDTQAWMNYRHMDLRI